MSVVIPTFNGKTDLEILLPKLFGQKAGFQFDVCCIDSGSTDGTWELLGEHPVRRHRIRKSKFSHGGTRNLGIGLTMGEVVVLMTQDAFPADDHLLARLAANYADPEVGGVYARQIPRPGGTLLPRIDLSVCQTGRTLRSVNRLRDYPDYSSLPPLRRRELCNFDNICSSIRRTAWEQVHLPETDFAEDLDWGKRAFESGWTIVYEPAAIVMHSHNRSFLYELKRSFVTYDILRDIFGYRHQFSLNQLYKTLTGLRGSLRRGFPEQLKDSTRRERMRAYWIIFARVLGQWIYSIWQHWALDRHAFPGPAIRKFFYSGV